MSLFRRKPDDRPPTGNGDARGFDEIVSPFFETSDWAGLTRALDRIDPQELDEPQAIRWHTSRGVAAERSGRRDEAVSAYSEGVSTRLLTKIGLTSFDRVLRERS